MLPRAAVAADRVDEVLSSRTVIHDPKTPKKFEEKQKSLFWIVRRGFFLF